MTTERKFHASPTGPDIIAPPKILGQLRKACRRLTASATQRISNPAFSSEKFRLRAASRKFYEPAGEHKLGVVISRKSGCERQATNKRQTGNVPHRPTSADAST